jgi:hypothetical protein
MSAEYCLGNLSGKKPLVRPRLRWEVGIKVCSRVVGWDGVDEVHWCWS